MRLSAAAEDSPQAQAWAALQTRMQSSLEKLRASVVAGDGAGSSQGTPLVEDDPQNIRGNPKVREAYLGESA